MTSAKTPTALGIILMDLARKKGYRGPTALAKACGLSRMTVYNLCYRGGCSNKALGRIFRGLALNQQEWFEIGLAISGTSPIPLGKPASDEMAFNSFIITTEDL